MNTASVHKYRSLLTGVTLCIVFIDGALSQYDLFGQHNNAPAKQRMNNLSPALHAKLSAFTFHLFAVSHDSLVVRNQCRT